MPTPARFWPAPVPALVAAATGSLEAPIPSAGKRPAATRPPGTRQAAQHVSLARSRSCSPDEWLRPHGHLDCAGEEHSSGRSYCPQASPFRLVIAGRDAGRQYISVGPGDRAAAAGRLPVRLFAEQRLTEPVKLGDDLLRGRAHRLPGPFAQFLQLPRNLALDVGGNLVLPQLLEFPFRLADRRPQVFGSGVRFADHLAAFTGGCFQPVEFAHGSLLAPVSRAEAPRDGEKLVSAHS